MPLMFLQANDVFPNAADIFTSKHCFLDAATIFFAALELLFVLHFIICVSLRHVTSSGTQLICIKSMYNLIF